MNPPQTAAHVLNSLMGVLVGLRRHHKQLDPAARKRWSHFRVLRAVSRAGA